MTTSRQALQAKVDAGLLSTVPFLFDSTLDTFAFTRATPRLYAIQPPEFLFIDFILNVIPVQSGAFSLTVSFYTVSGAIVTEIGTATSADQATVFSKELATGLYYVGIQSNTNTTYAATILATYRNYQRTANFQAPGANGERMECILTRKVPSQFCDKELFFELVEGTLPPGIYLNGVGYVKGVAPNMDCIADNLELSPAQNWSFKHNDDSFHPWGRQWRFKARVSLLESPAIFKEEWFCVKIHNNWTYDRDNFNSQAPHDRPVEFMRVEEPYPMPQICPVYTIEEAWTPKPIILPTLVKSLGGLPSDLSINGGIATPADTPGAFDESGSFDFNNCPSCTKSGDALVEKIEIPYEYIGSIDVRFFKTWMLSIAGDADLSIRYNVFVQAVMATTGFTELCGGGPVEVSTGGQYLYFRTYKKIIIPIYEPTLTELVRTWQHEENQTLPITGDSPVGEAMSINIS